MNISPALMNLKKDSILQKYDGIKNKNSEERNKKAAEDLEKMFFTNMLKQLFPEKEEGLFGTNGQAASMMKDMWIEAVASCGGAKCLGLSKNFAKALNNNN